MRVILIYDLFAFVTELPLGIILDRLNHLRISGPGITGFIAASGCATIAMVDLAGAFDIIPPVFFTPAAIVMGIGNAAFHLGAGMDVISLSKKKATFPGIFISTGALGLFLGTGATSMQIDNLLIMGALLAVIALFLLRQSFRETFLSSAADGTILHTKREYIFLAVIFLFLVILYRSFLGFASKYSWRSGLGIGFAAVAAVMLGKITGGIAADHFGWKRTISISLVICAVAAVFSDTSIAAGCLVLLLFNMTMSMAMIGLANLLPEWKGLAFGLNTAALFTGFAAYRLIGIQISGIAFCIMILLSALIFLTALFIAPEMEG